MGLCMGKLPNCRVVMIGLDGAGKSTLLYRLKTHSVVNTLPTIGFNVEEVIIEGTSVVVWDLGGQAKIRSTWENYIEGVGGLVFVVDSADVSRLHEAHLELSGILRHEAMTTCKTVLVFANKQDERGALKVDQISQHIVWGGASSSSFSSAAGTPKTQHLRTPSDPPNIQHAHHTRVDSDSSNKSGSYMRSPALVSNNASGSSNLDGVAGALTLGPPGRVPFSGRKTGEGGADEGIMVGRSWLVQECCALTGEGLEEGLSWLINVKPAAKV